ncbi:MAG: hypothetical protein JO011_05565, partial [Ktedonobacteraceae bacterium]|nr:hypothetical protein [Ktedonobacteraceae bacterium]
LPDAVARALELHMESINPPKEVETAQNGNSHAHGDGNGEHAGAINPLNLSQLTVTGNLCPECGCNTMVYEEGCRKCYSCGHSEC